MLFPVGLELAVVLFEDHLRRVVGHLGLDRAQLFDLVQDLVELAAPYLARRVAIEVADGSCRARGSAATCASRSRASRAVLARPPRRH